MPFAPPVISTTFPFTEPMGETYSTSAEGGVGQVYSCTPSSASTAVATVRGASTSWPP
jgi:hypothetical protein